MEVFVKRSVLDVSLDCECTPDSDGNLCQNLCKGHTYLNKPAPLFKYECIFSGQQFATNLNVTKKL